MQTSAEKTLRKILLALSGFTFLGAVVELLFSEHTQSAVQFIPFLLIALGLTGIWTFLRKQGLREIRLLRLLMVIVILGSLLGVYFHIAENLASLIESEPAIERGAALFEALRGDNPLMAPGILALAALMAIAASHAHPALAQSERLRNR